MNRDAYPPDDYLPGIDDGFDEDDDFATEAPPGPRVIRRRFEYEPATDSYFVTEFYRGGGQSERRKATEDERKAYLMTVNGPTTVGRQTGGGTL